MRIVQNLANSFISSTGDYGAGRPSETCRGPPCKRTHEVWQHN